MSSLAAVSGIIDYVLQNLLFLSGHDVNQAPAQSRYRPNQRHA